MKKELEAQNRRHTSSSTDWEVLGLGEDSDRDCEVETLTGTTTEEGATSEDEETLTIIEGENDLKNQIEALRKELEATQGGKEEQLGQLEKNMEILKESSNKSVAMMKAELDEARSEVLRSKGEVEKAGVEMTKLKETSNKIFERMKTELDEARLEALRSKGEAEKARVEMSILKETSNNTVAGMKAELDEARLEGLRSKRQAEKAKLKLKDEMKAMAESHRAGHGRHGMAHLYANLCNTDRGTTAK